VKSDIDSQKNILTPHKFHSLLSYPNLTTQQSTLVLRKSSLQNSFTAVYRYTKWSESARDMTSYLVCNRLFNIFYDNNILLLQLKYPLNGQHMTEVEPVLHSHTTAQATNSPCGGPAQYQTMDQVVLRKASPGSFCLPLSGLFHHCSTSIYSFIYH
jgi:hypothetical protein